MLWWSRLLVGSTFTYTKLKCIAVQISSQVTMMQLGKLQVVEQLNSKNSASVVFLHGSGDTGEGFLNWIKFLVGDFSLPHIKFYFPTAPLRPYTPLQGELSNVWFDRYNLSPDVPEHESILDMGEEMCKLISRITQSGIPLNRIIIGGFSMGGALAFHTAYRFQPGLAGAFTMSSFLNDNSAVYKNIKSKDTPLYMAHGDRDTMVPMKWGQETYQQLTALGVKAEFKQVKNAMHEVKKNELYELLRWIQEKLPPLETDN